MKDIMSMTGKGYKHSGAHCFPPVPKTAELTPRLCCSLFNSENKFMGDQLSILDSYYFQQIPYTFCGH